MKKFRLAFYASCLITFVFSLAQGQATRTWVSGVGDDANPCSRTTPCKTFGGAMSKTAIGGEIDVLDPGTFGSFTIGKSITIDGGGMFAGISAAGTTGITINITNAADTAKSVRLRGLSINGGGTGANGINIVAANKVSVEDCVIDGFSQNGILVAAGGVFIKNSTVRNNAVAGLNVSGSGQIYACDIYLLFNGAAMAGPGGSYGTSCNVVLYGNTSGNAVQSTMPAKTP